MPDDYPVTCPYCGEELEIRIDHDVRGSFVQDCEVCCNPWLVQVERDADECCVTIIKADGSE
jgi:Cysteine-rich CPXCG